MSFDINPLKPVDAAAATPPVAPVAALSRLAPATDPAVRLDVIPASPPPEVMREIATAAEAPQRLAAQGGEMRFVLNAATGHLAIQVHDLRGNLLFTAPPSKALDIAGGGEINLT